MNEDNSYDIRFQILWKEIFVNRFMHILITLSHGDYNKVAFQSKKFEFKVFSNVHLNDHHF